MSAAEPVKVHGFCGLCIARCGSIATVEDGRFTRLDPDPTHPTGQALCAKGRAAPELVYSRERLTTPLRRTRPKGDSNPGWVEISWDEALDAIAAAMRRLAATHGPQSVAFSQSSPSTTAIGNSAPFMRRLMNAFGTPNLVWALDLCGWGRGFATRYAFGVGQRRHRQRRRSDGGHREQRVPDPMGLQPLLHAAHARDGHGRGAQARDEAHRHRSAPCRACEQGRPLAAHSSWRRRGARARPRACHDKPRLVRPRVRAGVDQRAASRPIR